MPDRNDVERIKKLLTEHHQDHLLAFWPELDSNQRADLLCQVRELDFPAVCEWVEHLVKGGRRLPSSMISSRLRPIVPCRVTLPCSASTVRLSS
jgi:hypothetical protein